ncbi:MAG: cell division protein ZapA [Rhodocyclaceae bacterium]|jgi:cell division protein ZapA|nr:cell division protein ZapA [Rhodocyclaceae bacterium]
MSTTLDIKIQGREYRVACAPGEVESLQAAADLLNARMGEIAKATKSTGERLAVMTALNLAHELNAARQDSTAVPQPVEKSIDDGEARRRIKAIEARLDAALAPQDSLF